MVSRLSATCSQTLGSRQQREEQQVKDSLEFAAHRYSLFALRRFAWLRSVGAARRGRPLVWGWAR